MTTKPDVYVVTLSALALGQLAEDSAYVHAAGAPLAAQHLAARLLAAIEALERNPYRGRPVTRGVYELLTVRPYVIRYRIRGQAVEVVRIRHAARRPD